jgi:flagellar biosynthesis/type III secretory pathway chaperone
MESRIEQLARVMRQEFDNITKDKTIIELIGLEDEINLIIETLILNGAEDAAKQIKADYEFELGRVV